MPTEENAGAPHLPTRDCFLVDRACTTSCMAMGNGHCRVLDTLKRIADGQETLTEQFKSVIESAWLK